MLDFSLFDGTMFAYWILEVANGIPNYVILFDYGCEGNEAPNLSSYN